MNVNEMLRDLGKLKFEPTDIYLLSLRQTLINQKEILLSTGRGGSYGLAKDTDKLIRRIDEFIENRQ